MMLPPIKNKYEIRCPIHQSIYFDDFEKQIIDHPIFQRLRFISQLGFVSMAYPSAINNRFTHSLGVMHLAHKLFINIIANSNQLIESYYTPAQILYFNRIIRIAGLLHDVGHGPFSHTFEVNLPQLDKIKLPKSWYKTHKDWQCQAHHEDFSILLIKDLFIEIANNKDVDFFASLAQDVASLISSEINPTKNFRSKSHPNVSIYPLLKSLISGEVDADRMDYLLRDSYYCGVPYGQYDLHRISHNLLCFFQEKKSTINLGIKKSSLFSFEDFLMARYHMFQQVYFLKTIPPFDYYLTQAIRNNEIDITIPTNVKEFIALRDDVVWAKLFENKEKFWSSKIVNRETAHHLFTIEDIGLEDKLSLKNMLIKILKKDGIEVFVMRAKQYLSMVGNGDDSSKLYVIGKWLGKSVIEPVEKYSTLIAKYNIKIEKDNIYCLKSDKIKASKTIEKIWDQEKIPNF